MLWVPISVAIAIACLWSEVAATVPKAGACHSLLQHGKQHSLASSEVDGVDSCPRIMQRLQAFDSSDLLDACNAALADAALCLQAEQELRREGKPCDILGPVWGQLQDQTRILLLERRSRKRMSAVHEESSLVKRSNSNQQDVDAAATSGGNTSNGSDSENATGGTTSTSNGTAQQDSGDGRRRKKSQDAEQGVWDNLLISKLGYNHAQTEPIPSNHKSDPNVSKASIVDNNTDLEDAVPSNSTEAASTNQSNK